MKVQRAVYPTALFLFLCIQIKTTKHKSKKLGIFKTNLRTLGGNQIFSSIRKREKGDYDLLYVLTDDNTSYLIPDDDFECGNSLSLGAKMDKYKIIL